MANSCPFTRYREIEKVVKNSELFSTKKGLNHLRSVSSMLRRVGLRHALPILKNAPIILKAMHSNKKGRHGRFSELPPAESVRYRVPINSFLQKRTWDDVKEVIDRHLETAKRKRQLCLSQELIGPCNAEVTMKLLGIPKKNWGVYKQPNYDFVFDLNKDEILGLISRMRARHLLEKEVARQRSFPEKNGLIEFLINFEKKGEAFSDAEIAGSVWMMLGGHTTTDYFLSNALNYFAKDQQTREDFMKNPYKRSPILEELLRFFTPGFQSQRLVMQDFSIEERKFKKGEAVTLHWAKANFDESVFENPEEINFDRKNKEHLSFGAGSRYCLGAGFVRGFVELFLIRFFEEFPNYQVNSQGAVKSQTAFDGFERLPADLAT
jgi:cytochrome P450